MSILIDVDLDRNLFESSADDIDQANHEEPVDALGIPADDLFQVFAPHGAGELRFDRGFETAQRRNLVLIRITAVYMYTPAAEQQV